MKTLRYARFICAALAAVMLALVMGISASAAIRQGRIGETAGEDGFIEDSADSAAGTGEFADDTSSSDQNNMDGTNDTSDNSSSDHGSSDHGSSDHGSPVESAIDGIVTDAEGAVEDAGNAMSGMGIWGVIIAIVIIATIVVLIFAFFSKKK